MKFIYRDPLLRTVRFQQVNFIGIYVRIALLGLNYFHAKVIAALEVLHFRSASINFA